MCKSREKMSRTKKIILTWLMRTITIAVFWGGFIAVALIIYG